MAAPTLFAISGSNDFLRRRALEQTVSKQRAAGWDVQFVDGANNMDLMTGLHQSASMFGDGKPVLLVVYNPEQAPLPALEGQLKNEDPAVTLLLSLEGDPKGNTKFGKFVAALDKKAHQAFPMPEKKWETPKIAAAFCVGEAKRLGKPMAEDLAHALVQKSGVDYGFLAFELQKAILHAEARGATALEVVDVRAAMAPIGEVSFDEVKNALATRNKKAVAQALERIRKAVKEPIMPLCGFLEAVAIGSKTEKEGRISFGWLHLATLNARGLSPDDIATELGINPYRCKSFLLPEVRAWQPAAVLSLVQATSEARRAVLTGQLNPWLVFVARILALCSR